MNNNNNANITKNSRNKKSLLIRTQSRIMGVAVGINPNGTCCDYLTTKQRQRIVKNWRSIPDRRQMGRQIYVQIFMHKPSLKSLFPFRNISAEKLALDPYFRRQGALFADFLHSIVGYVQLNDEKKLRETCQRIGDKHARMTKVNFEPDWWRLFVSSTLDCLRPFYKQAGLMCCCTRFSDTTDSSQAWNVLLSHVVDIMSESFYETKHLLKDPNAIGENVEIDNVIDGEKRKNEHIDFYNNYSKVTLEDDEIIAIID